MDSSAQMEQLVDAFKGLAIEGDSGRYLADVEAIVNNYFSQHSEGDGQGSQREDLDDVRSPQGVQPGMPGMHVDPRQPLQYADVMGESPIRPRASPAKGDVSHASSGSLKAWGEAVELETQPQQVRQSVGVRQELQLIPECDDDFYSRSVEWRRRQTEQRGKQKTVNEERETDGCTWKPSINNYSYTNSGRLVYGKVEDRLYASETARQQRLEDERRKQSERKTDGCTFKPNINTSSRYSASQVSERADPFERLYKAGRKPVKKPRSSSSSNTSRAPVLFTTYNPSRPPKQGVDISQEDVDAMENELAEIEHLLNTRMRPPTRIALVDSNYIDSDEEPMDDDESVDTAGRSDSTQAEFEMFLLRQNAFEERRRANLQFLEADTAPSLHPTLTRRSMKGKKTNADDLAKPKEDMSEQRLQKLLLETVELHAEVSRVQSECSVLTRKITLLRRLPSGESRPSPVFSQLQKALRPLKGALEEPTITVAGKPLKVGPEDDDLREAFAERCAEKPSAKLRPLRPRTRDPAERKEVVQRWVRELIEVRNGLAEVRTRSSKLCDSLAQEKERCMRARDGVIPWETAMDIDFPRPKAPGKTEQGEKVRADAMVAVIGDKVKARREDWQSWQKGELIEIRPPDGRKRSDIPVAVVLLEGCKVPQCFPGSTTCVVPENPEDLSQFAQTARHRMKEQYLLTCIKTKETVTVRLTLHGDSLKGRVISGEGSTWVVAVMEADSGRLVRKSVSIDMIRLPKDVDSENYGPNQLRSERAAGNCVYLERLEEQKKQTAAKREKALRDREMKEEGGFTYTPHINSAPRYVSRIAQSMQLLRGEPSYAS